MRFNTTNIVSQIGMRFNTTNIVSKRKYDLIQLI